MEVALSAGSDTSDLLGGFEQLEPARAAQARSVPSVPSHLGPALGSRCEICTGSASLWHPSGQVPKSNFVFVLNEVALT